MRMTKELRTHKRWEREQSFKSSLRIVQKKKKKKEGKKDEGRLGRRRVGSCPGRNPLIDGPANDGLSNEQLNANPTAKIINSNHHKYQPDCTLFSLVDSIDPFTTCPFYFRWEPRIWWMMCVSVRAAIPLFFVVSLHHPSYYSPHPLLY